MKFNDEQPIYTQIMDYIKSMIVRGELKIGEQVPSVRDIAMALKVNPNTVQRSYSELRNENILFSKRGLGNFVTEDEDIVEELKISMAKNTLSVFISEMKRLGLSKEDSINLIKNFWEENDD